MFDINSLSNLIEAFPEDVKQKVKQAMEQQFSGKTGELNTSTMAKLGLAIPGSGHTRRRQRRFPGKFPKTKPMN